MNYASRHFVWILWLLLLGPALSAAEDLRVDGVDVYGTAQLDAEGVRKVAATELGELAQAIAARDGARTQDRKAKIADQLKAGRSFAYLAVSPILYYPPHAGLYVTIDVVEQRDAARRMPFRSSPTAVRSDPDGLLAAWYEYEEKVGTLASRGELPPMKECPVLHCLASFDPPSLHPYLDRFNAGARANKTLLASMTVDDSDPKHRTAALYVLAHANDPALLLPLLGQALFDPDEMVRNAGMRVLGGMSRKGVDVDYPIRDVIAALDFPATTDRNKAAYVLSNLVRIARYRDAVLANALPTLMQLLRLEQPNNHAFAFEILKTVSGKDFGERDYEKWESWAAQAVQGGAP